MLLASLALPFIAGCGGDDSSFSLLPDADVFQAGSSGNDKLDILWVIDSSGSMRTSQQNLADNMSSFIDNFSNKNLDFRMTVIGTDAFRQQFGGGDTCAEFRDGPVRVNYASNPLSCVESGNHNGFPMITPGTPDMLNAFLNNVLQGIQGYGDERPLQSISTALSLPANSGFIRNNSFVSVIILTDEDDFSHDNGNHLQSNPQGINHPALHPVQDYVNYLDGVTNSTGASRRYNVNSIAIFDPTCLASLQDSFQERVIAERVGQLSDATNGLKTSLCGNFANDLDAIASNIVALSNKFILSRIPKPETIEVKVGGVVIPEDTEAPFDDNGWVYDPVENSILIFGPYQPSAGQAIEVSFDPKNFGS